MCRGCRYLSKGTHTIDDYMSWHEFSKGVGFMLKELEKEAWKYTQLLDSVKDRRQVDRYRRQIIRLRRAFGRADQLLNKEVELVPYLDGDGILRNCDGVEG